MRETSARSVDMYVASVRDRLRSALQEAQAQSTAEACQQKQYYNRKIVAVNLKSGTSEETWEVVCQIMTDVPSYEVMNQHGWS